MSVATLSPGHALRIGVTGTRKDTPPHVADQVDAILRLIVEWTPDTKGIPCRRQILSPLAQGADRLVARAALAQHFTLVCPLPFDAEAYKQDFPDAAQKIEFDTLRRQAANALTLDSDRPVGLSQADYDARAPQDTFAYEAVGRLIARNCDLMIGIWDGSPGKGRGGTAEIIRYAADFGPPVIWINATEDRPPVWIAEGHDLMPGAAPRAPVEALLPFYLHRLLTRPTPGHHDHHSIIKRGTFHLCQGVSGMYHRLRKRERPDPVTVFLHEREKTIHWPWTLNRLFLDAMNWRPRARLAAAPDEPNLTGPWADRYHHADGLANAYAARYRSSYVLIFILATIAVAVAAIGPELQTGGWHILGTALELIALGGIGILVVADAALNWQSKAIEYRLLAELCRKQHALAPLGWSVPRSIAWATTEADPPHDETLPPIEPISWVSWLFSAWLRDTGLPPGTLTPERVATAKQMALDELLDPQIAYNQSRARRSYQAGKRLIHLGEGVFFIVLALVALKAFCPLWPVDVSPDHTQAAAWTEWVNIALAILPALSAAFVGIRAYAELEMLADQSTWMLRALNHARKQIAELDPHASLASQFLGSALAGVATLMLEDLEGWARLFRGKALDP